jgi:hypothetical protein
MNRHQLIKGKDKSNIKGWHFLPKNGKLRYSDNRKVAKGKWLKYKKRRDHDRIRMCRVGMHASKDLFDAMNFGQCFGGILCRVDLRGDRIYARNKVCAEERKIVWMINIDPLFFNIASLLCPRRWVKIRDKNHKLRKRRDPEKTDWKKASKDRPIAALRTAMKDSIYSEERCKQIIMAAIINAKQKQDKENKKRRRK